jgi:hypothetical protein
MGHAPTLRSEPFDASLARSYAEQGLRGLLRAVAQIEKQNAFAVEEVRSQVAWLEERGWRTGEDGLWRHPRRAANIGLVHSQAFTVEARVGPSTNVLDVGPGQPAETRDD